MYYQNYSKYHAKKTPCRQGHIHDSVKEAARCNELHMLLKSEAIQNLEVQKKYLLIPALYETVTLKDIYKVGENKGKHKTKQVCVEQAVYYLADFVYFDKEKEKTIIEDCKGVRTKEYVIKRKLMKQQYCQDGSTVFIET